MPATVVAVRSAAGHVDVDDVVLVAGGEGVDVGVGQHVVGRGDHGVEVDGRGVADGAERLEARHRPILVARVPVAAHPRSLDLAAGVAVRRAGRRYGAVPVDPAAPVPDPDAVLCDLDGVIWLAQRPDPRVGRGGGPAAGRRPAGRVRDEQLLGGRRRPRRRRWRRSGSRRSATC